MIKVKTIDGVDYSCKKCEEVGDRFELSDCVHWQSFYPDGEVKETFSCKEITLYKPNVIRVIECPIE